eukprot:TRINITY_DN4536_c0_g2_i3.p2 TRINITY_DN4536_c0_g2~~TRINITY_DN4536_c0_g2_i3.p2  ORF type:complete len:112 (+),score=27.87 TRINITY_DN4536_c0_g2_i3:73-408(+)
MCIRDRKKEYSRLQRVIFSQLRSKDREEKRMNVLALTQQKLLYEDEERLRIEADIAQLENEEYELIQKLQNTELLQHSGSLAVNRSCKEPARRRLQSHNHTLLSHFRLIQK